MDPHGAIGSVWEQASNQTRRPSALRRAEQELVLSPCQVYRSLHCLASKEFDFRPITAPASDGTPTILSQVQENDCPNRISCIRANHNVRSGQLVFVQKELGRTSCDFTGHLWSGSMPREVRLVHFVSVEFHSASILVSTILTCMYDNCTTVLHPLQHRDIDY